MKTAKEWLESPNLYATSSLILLTDAWGTEFFDWDPLTVELELKSTFGVESTPMLMDRINATTALFNSNLFFLSLENFLTTCNVLNFGVISPDALIPADIEDVMWGVSEATVILGEPEDKFSHNIARYVGVLLSQAGLSKPPPILSFAEMPEYNQGFENEVFNDEIEAQVFYKKQEDEALDLETQNNSKLVSLFTQISNLPVKNGSTAFIKDRLESTLKESRV